MGGIAAAAVIGAGVMGSGIAAQFANAGIPVLLLDLVPGDGPRNALAEAALQRLKRSDPPAFMHRSAEALVTPGNVDDHFGRLAWAYITDDATHNLDVLKYMIMSSTAMRALPQNVARTDKSEQRVARRGANVQPAWKTQRSRLYE